MKKVIITTTIIIFAWLILNIPYLNYSINVHNMILAGNYKSESVQSYIKDIASKQIRGCTIGAKIISLSCYDFIPNWSLGDENFNHIKDIITQQQEAKPKPKDLFEENHTLEYFQDLSQKKTKTTK